MSLGLLLFSRLFLGTWLAFSLYVVWHPKEPREERRRAMDRMKETDYEVMVAGGGLVSYGLESEDVGSAAISEVEKLANEFEAHESEEAKFVRSYKEILERTRDPLIKFLLRLIVSD